MHDVSPSLPQADYAAWHRTARRLGVGTLLVAVGWTLLGGWLFREVGTLTLLWEAGEFLRTNERVQAATSAAPTQTGSALSILTFSSPRTVTSLDQAKLIEKKRLLVEYEKKVVMVEGARHVWSLLTTLFIGMLVAGGIGLCLTHAPHSRASRALRTLSALLIAASMFALGLSIGMHHRGDWNDTLVRLTQERDAWLRPAMLAVAAAALTLLLGLSSLRGPRAWMGLSAAAGLLGTFVTLLAISLMIRAGLPPLPPWMYAVVALVQSSWSWVMLFAMLRVPGMRNHSLSVG